MLDKKQKESDEESDEAIAGCAALGGNTAVFDADVVADADTSPSRQDAPKVEEVEVVGNEDEVAEPAALLPDKQLHAIARPHIAPTSHSASLRMVCGFLS